MGRFLVLSGLGHGGGGYLGSIEWSRAGKAESVLYKYTATSTFTCLAQVAPREEKQLLARYRVG